MYFPWAGLFDQIKNCDIFVHYDDAILPQGRSFCSRVQIRNGLKTNWMSLPIKKSKISINKVRIDNTQKWKKKHIRMIKYSLSKAKYFLDMWELIKDMEEIEFETLDKINAYYTEKISAFLGFKTKFIFSSSYNLNLKSSEHLLEICKLNGATTYITGHGATNFLNHEIFEKENIKVKYMKYDILNYLDLNKDFTPFFSILDLIANRGKASENYMKSKLIYWKNFNKTMLC